MASQTNTLTSFNNLSGEQTGQISWEFVNIFHIFFTRKFCLTYGASLFFTSVKEDKNCDLLYKYLVHKNYNFSFTTPALVVERDAVFIPAGRRTLTGGVSQSVQLLNISNSRLGFSGENLNPSGEFVQFPPRAELQRCHQVSLCCQEASKHQKPGSCR